MSPSILNIAGYRFAPIADPAGLRARIRARCAGLGVRGTVLVAPEGINVFMAGPEEEIGHFKKMLAEETGIEVEFKVSWSVGFPFERLLIKLKKEIIACDPEGVLELDPSSATGMKIGPAELKQWIEKGREFVLLDTRNDYEVRAGTFRGARSLEIGHFRHFRGAVEKLLPELRDTPIVTFCTGGIRCEKAAPLMEQAGFREVYQLEGGILKYFEKVGGDHWQGGCFVFDGRGALDPALRPVSVAENDD